MKQSVDLKYLVKSKHLSLAQWRLFKALANEPTPHVYSRRFMARHHLTTGGIRSGLKRLLAVKLVVRDDGVWRIFPPELQTWWNALGGNHEDAERLRFVEITLDDD